MTAAVLSPRAARIGLSAATGAIVCWSIGNIMVAKVPMPGLQIAFWRILLGAVVYSAVVYGAGRRITWVHLRRSAATGACISLEIAIFFVAIRATTVASATTIGSLVPLLLMGVAARQFGEQVTRFLVGVSVVSLGGVVLVMSGASSSTAWSLRGDLLAVVALVFFAGYFALAKSAREHVPALEFQACIWIVGSVVLFPIAVVDASGVTLPTAEQWAWIAALLAVPGTGHMLMNWAHPRVRLTITAMLTLAVPVLTTTGGVLFLDQSIGALQVVGIAVVLGGLSLVIRREAQLVGNS
ncbi:MAG: DMT family transporter [Acidimicrobiales bacterium]|nr:DMT family transporter [Acidimicrobiales bacterium]